MIIKEAYMKNFGKFQKKRISFQQGINIVYGENESGKTTLYTFLQGVFFGIPRKRGTASKTDTYTRCLPWSNPSWYEGSVLFEEGGKDFRLERNFDSRSREAELYCVTDGEKMSVEEGDLEILLGGATQRIYENTAAIGQLKSRTREGLREELEEYLANFQTEGDFLLDPQAALSRLKEQRKEWEKAEKEALNEKEQRMENLRYRIRYTRKEMEDLEKRLEKPEESMENTDDEKGMDTVREEERKSQKKLAAILIFLVLGGAGTVLLWSLDLGGWYGWLIRWCVPLLVLLAVGENFRRYLRERKKEEARSRRRQERALKKERRAGQRSTWQELLRDKETLLYNLQEELEELENDNGKIRKARKEAGSIALAEKMLTKAAGSLQSRRGNFLKEKTWKILGELTQGKYQRGIMDENFQIRLDSGDQYVGLYQVSQGTVEQVYFALRMAAAELLCQEEELPLILDETFAMYDDRRLAQALFWLHKNRRQAILFTCTRRESQILEKLGIPWHQVNL